MATDLTDMIVVQIGKDDQVVAVYTWLDFVDEEDYGLEPGMPSLKAFYILLNAGWTFGPTLPDRRYIFYRRT